MSGKRNDNQKQNKPPKQGSSGNGPNSSQASKGKNRDDEESVPTLVVASEDTVAVSVEATRPTKDSADGDDDIDEEEEDLPKHVLNRIMGLKMLHEEKCCVDDEFKRKRAELEKEYQTRVAPIFIKRRDIASGAVGVDIEFNREDDATSDVTATGTALSIANEVGSPKVVASVVTRAKNADEVDDKGIPQFWLESIVHHRTLCTSLVDDDVDALKHLIDVSCTFTYNPEPCGCKDEDHDHDEDDDSDDPALPSGYILNFRFSENDYFTDEVLTKQYVVRNVLEKESEMVLVDIKGCQIHWKQDKNLTVKTISKKKRVKGSGKRGGNSTQVVQRVVKKESFFNFFSPPSMEVFKQKAEEVETGVDDDDDEDDDDKKKKKKQKGKKDSKPNRSDTEESTPEEDDIDALEIKLDADFESGEAFRCSLIPEAVLWYTGEAMDDDDSAMDGLDDEDDDEDPDDDGDDEEEEEAPIIVSGKKSQGRLGGSGRGSGPSGGKKGPGADGEKPECKQS